MSKRPEEILNNYIDIACGCVDEENRLWFSSINLNSLYSYDLSTDEFMFKDLFHGEELWKGSLYRNCIKWQDKIIFAPFNARAVAVFNIKDQTMEKIPIQDFGRKSERYYNLSAYENKVFLFGETIPNVAILNIDTYEITYCDDLYQEIERLDNTGNRKYLGKGTVLSSNGETLWLNGWRCRSVIEFHMSDQSFSVKPLSCGSGVFNNIKVYGDELILVPGKGECVVVFDKKTGEYREIGEPLTEKARYFCAYTKGDDLYCFPDMAEHILRVNLQDGNSEELESPLKDYKDPLFLKKDGVTYSQTKFVFFIETENEYLYFSRMNRTLYRRNKYTGEMRKKQLFMELPNRANYVYTRMEEGRPEKKEAILIREGFLFTLADFAAWTAQDGWEILLG